MKNALTLFGTKKFNSLVDQLFGDNFLTMDFTDSPKVNIKETDKAYEIEIASPGFDKENTNVEILNGMLSVTINSESESGNGEDDTKYHVREWSKSSFSESWNIPEDVIEDEIAATSKNGVLMITLPKKAKIETLEKPKSIKID